MRDDKKVVNHHLDLFSCQFRLRRRCGYVTKQIPRRTIHKHLSPPSVRRRSTQEQSVPPPREWDRGTIPCDVTFLGKLRLSVAFLSFCGSPSYSPLIALHCQLQNSIFKTFSLFLSEKGVHKSYLCLLSPQSSSR